MIAFLNGRVAAKSPTSVIIEVGGIGYRLNMSTTSLSGLPAVGDEVQVHTYLHVREDELTLFGFENEPEQFAFERLITVSGVGPKVALSALSALSPESLAAAVAADDVATISSVPGIGAKTAQRIILELKDKLDVGTGAVTGSAPAAAGAEALQALLAMGISSAEANAALKGYDAEPSVEAMIKYALRRLGGGS